MKDFLLSHTNENNMKKGLFIVLYGVNNLGKTTQAKLLVERLQKEGHPAEYMKYAIYDLAPSGPLINNYLRGGNTWNLSAREVQLLHSLNRTQYEPTLLEKLANGITIVAEDYIGTSIAWGAASGAEEAFVRDINTHLQKEDLAILLTGTRFTDSTELGHPNETNEERMRKAIDMHEKLGNEFGWQSVNANQTIESIHEQIYNALQEKLR